jgi:hypothetical protein
MLRDGEILIHDGNAGEHAVDPVVGGERKARGLVPRDWETHPAGCYKSAPATSIDMPVIDQSEWSQRLKDKVAAKALLSDIRMTGNNGGVIPSLDQNGKGYCWAHSSTSAVTMLRAVANDPYVPLSAYAVACIIKGYADEGGWGAQSLDFVTERGVPSAAFWPMQSMSHSNDKPETWANAKLHRVTEGWVDVAVQQYDRRLTFAQVATCLLCDVPVVVDFNWWSHSVCAVDLVEGASARSRTRAASGKKASLRQFEAIWDVDGEAGGFGVRILNSWGDSWSDHGMGTLAGQKAIPDGAVAPRVTIASAA